MKMKSAQSIHPCKSVIQTSYDIVTEGHEGELKVASREYKGITF